MALRPLLLLLTLSFTLYASPLDFRACQLKYGVSSVHIDNTQGFAIDRSFAISYSEKEPDYKIIKRDPFLGLNLIQAPAPFKHIFKFYKHTPNNLAAVTPTQTIEGKIIREQIGLNELAQFSNKIPENALITGTCCGILGLSTPNGIIEKEYLRHFIESETVQYSDMGIRLANQEGVRVVEVNPFFQDSPFMLDDIILFMDNKKARSAGQVSQDILFSKPGSLHYFIILRNAKKMKIQMNSIDRNSGGEVPESFFGFFGLELDENLVVKKDAPKFEIKKGDKLLLVMNKNVKTLEDIRRVLSQEKDSEEEFVFLLFQREGFDFFIHFKKPNNSN